VHRSRVAGFIIDCRTDDLDAAARFWSGALGMARVGAEDEVYQTLDASERDLVVLVQRVGHDSRVHVDIETDDLDAEAARLEGLGAKRIGFVKRWWVMEAPTGQRFCVVRARDPLDGAPGVTVWNEEGSS
jgi:hypothetical protein